MAQYIHYTEEEKSRARQTDLVELLRSQGETLKRSGSEYEWLDGNQKVTIRGNLWFHQYEQKGGDAVAFVRHFYGKSYAEAVQYLLGDRIGEQRPRAPIVEKTEKHFELPLKNDNMRRVFAYLIQQRGVDKDVLYAFVHARMIYESATYHNAVFVGYDAQGQPRHAHKRGTGSESCYKGNAIGSRPEYSFHWLGKSERLYLFEAPIDMLSFISLNKSNWRQHSYAASCSVSDRVLFQCLKDAPHIKSVSLCFDNDEAGQAAARRISEKLFCTGISSEVLLPAQKDWNEDLLCARQEGRTWAIQLS